MKNNVIKKLLNSFQVEKQYSVSELWCKSSIHMDTIKSYVILLERNGFLKKRMVKDKRIKCKYMITKKGLDVREKEVMII